MRKLLFILAVTIGGLSTLQAQDYGEDSVKCRENLYIYYELAKGKNYADAWESWKYVYDNCPGSSKNNFIFAPQIIDEKIDAATTDADKKKYIDLKLESYDKRLEYYPEKYDYVYYRKALDILKYYPDSTQAAYDLFKLALEKGGPEQSAAFYNGYFVAAARLFNEKVFDTKQVFDAYNVVVEGIEVNNNALNREIAKLQEKEEAGSITDKEKQELEKNKRELERYEDVESNIGKIVGPIATCDKLNDIYNETTFEANKMDETWLRRAAKMLQKERKNDEGETENCTDNAVFPKIAEALYKIQPSANAARAMWSIFYKQNEYSKAAEYIQEAVNQEVDPKKRADDNLKLAVTNQKMGRLSAAKAAALKAAKDRSGWGDPYIVIAGLYAQGYDQCGNDVFEKKAVFWAAIDKLQYARSIDESVANKANKMIASYKQQIPDKGASFNLGHTQGEKYTIGCFINETVTADWN